MDNYHWSRELRLIIYQTVCSWWLFQQLKLATGDEDIRRRIVRSAEEDDVETSTFDSRMEISEATTILTTETDEENEELEELEEEEEAGAGVTTEWSPAR